MVNSINVENSAILSLSGKLNDSGYIDISYIKKGDKEPIWDGDIYVYDSDEVYSKRNLKYKLPIQVKGTEKRLSKNISYPIDTIDLIHHMYNGGVLFFVIQTVKGNHQKNKIFYKELLPYQINEIIKNKENQQTISVPFECFPKNSKEITELLFNFGFDLYKQRKTPNLENIKFQNFDTIYINFETPYKNINRKEILLNFNRYGYFYKDNIPYPIKINKGDINCVSQIPESIHIKNKEYFSNYKLRESYNSQTIILADNIEFKFSQNITIPQECRLLFKGTLNKHIYCIKFLLDVANRKGFSIGKYLCGLLFDKDTFHQLKNNLQYYTKLQQALDICRCNKDLIIREFTEKDFWNSTALIESFSNNKEIELNTTHEGCVLNFTLCGYTIVCLAFRQNNKKYRFLPYPFNEDADICLNGEQAKVSAYSMLKHQYMEHSLNVNLDDCIDKIKQQTITYASLNQTNNFVLELLFAYDNTKEQKFLDTACEIIQWVEQNNTDIKSSVLYHLNTLQCQKRKNKELSEEDKNYLFNITDTNNDDSLKCGAAILLEEKDRAKRLLSKLDDAQQDKIKNSPIYNLWKDLNNG